MKRQGFAFIMAIASLPLAVLAIESVASVVAADIKQTQQLAAQAQVEQLLLAGCLTASRGQSITLPADARIERGTCECRQSHRHR